MIFDRTCQVKHNFDHKLQEVLAKTNPSLPFPAPQADDEEDVIMLH